MMRHEPIAWKFADGRVRWQPSINHGARLWKSIRGTRSSGFWSAHTCGGERPVLYRFKWTARRAARLEQRRRDRGDWRMNV